MAQDAWCLRDLNGAYPDVILPFEALDEDGLVDLEAKCVELAVTSPQVQVAESSGISLAARASRSEKCNTMIDSSNVISLGRHTHLPPGQRLLHHAISRIHCLVVRSSKPAPSRGRTTPTAGPRASPFVLIALGASPTYLNNNQLASVEAAVVAELLGDEPPTEMPSAVTPLNEGDIITLLEPWSEPSGLAGALSPLSPLRHALDRTSAPHHRLDPLPRFQLCRSTARTVERSPSPLTNPQRSLL